MYVGIGGFLQTMLPVRSGARKACAVSICVKGGVSPGQGSLADPRQDPELV